MKHLLPYLQDDQKAADYLRQVRWPDGVTCPRCGSDAVEPRERCDNGLQRFNCVPCATRLGQQFAMFTDWTNSIFEESKMRPDAWLLVMGLWQLKLNATDIAAAADIQERTAQRCINVLAGGIYETYHLEPTRQLAHQVEADECSQSAGSKGRPREVERHEREPRQRGLQLRGRATAEMGRPPLLGLVQRRDQADPDAPAAPVYLEVLENVRTATIKPIIAAKVKAGTQFFTDEYSNYSLMQCARGVACPPCACVRSVGMCGKSRHARRRMPALVILACGHVLDYASSTSAGCLPETAGMVWSCPSPDGWRAPIRSTVTFPALLTLEMTENMVSFADLYRAGPISLRLGFQE